MMSRQPKPTSLAPSHSSACRVQPHKLSSPLLFPRKTHNPKIACKSTFDDYQKSNSGRHEVLIGLGDLCGVTIGNGGFKRMLLVAVSIIFFLHASAAPVQGPDISNCALISPQDHAPYNCCPPVKGEIVDFKLPPKSAPFRVRRAAHAVDEEYIEKYAKAIELMKALPAHDPRNFNQQGNVHCAYCNGAYHQLGLPDFGFLIHGNWLFFPWHRFYLYFNERILGKLIGDDTFALPFWNWDAPVGMQLPAMYTNVSSSLYDRLREAKHQPLSLVNLDYNKTDPDFTQDQQIDYNLKIMYRQVISNGKTPELFMGPEFRGGEHPKEVPGSIENAPHNTVHAWTGDRNQPNKDMGNFYTAATDPLFYAHHANIDRLWYIRKKLGGKHQDFTDSDWLNTTFLFYDECHSRN